jgi:hypothetical protein
VYPVPVVSSVSPTTGLPLGGTTVTVTGTGLTGATSVLFGNGAPGTDVQVVSDTQLTVVSPLHAKGSVNVRVVTPGGESAEAAADQFVYRIPLPVVSSVSPSSGPPSGFTQVSVMGTGLSSVTSVLVGGASPVTYFPVSDTQIVVLVQPHALGTVNIQVVTPDGTTAVSAADKYTYKYPTPVITSVSPSSGSPAGGPLVTISGNGFSHASSVVFGGVAANPVFVQSDNQIEAAAPPHAIGTVNIKVTTPGGTSAVTTDDQYTYAHVVPAITGVSPAQGSASGGAAVTITGTGLSEVTTVSFGAGNPATKVVVKSDTDITAYSPAHADGTVDITATSPDGTSPVVPADEYTYALTIAAVTAVSPSTGSPSGGTQVTIAGSALSGATQVLFGSVAADVFSVDSDNQLTAFAPAQAAGTVDITVVSSDGTSPVVAADQYDYELVVPAITGVSPSTGSPSGGASVTITGSDFSGATQVLFGSDPASPFSVDSDTQITVFLAPAHADGAVDITVVGPDGTSPVVAADQYTYAAVVPAVTKVSPGSGPSAGGTQVTIIGSGFSAATEVFFGSDQVSKFSVDSDTQITVLLAPGQPAGTVDVTVVSLDGTSPVVTGDQYTYV